MMNKRYSLHKIHNESSCPFDESAYSKFKFGDTEVVDMQTKIGVLVKLHFYN